MSAPVPVGATKSGTTGTTTCTATIHASVQAGDDLYCQVPVNENASNAVQITVTDDDAGGNTWTQLLRGTNGNSFLFWKKATSGSAGKTVTVANAENSVCSMIVAYRGGAAGDPTTNLSFEDNASGNETHAGFTPDFADSMICLAVFNYVNDLTVATEACTDPGALTEPIADATSTGGADCATAHAAAAQSGGPTATGNFTWAQTNAASQSMVWAIKPAVAGGDVTGTGAPTEAPDTAAASGTVTVTGSAAPGEALDTSAGSGLVIITGSAAPAEADDTPAASGLVSVVGNAAPVEAADTAAASGALAVIGSASPAEADDTADGVGSIPIDVTGSAAPAEADDAASGAGLVLQNVTGAAAPSEANDTAAGAGLVQVIGASAASEGADTALASGLVIVTGSATPAEADDTADGVGTVLQNITGSAAVAEQNDAASASGVVAQHVTGDGAAAEADDIAVASGTVTVTGSAAAIEENDAASGIVVVSDAGTVGRITASDSVLTTVTVADVGLGASASDRGLGGATIADDDLTVLAGGDAPLTGITARDE